MFSNTPGLIFHTVFQSVFSPFLSLMKCPPNSGMEKRHFAMQYEIIALSSKFKCSTSSVKILMLYELSAKNVFQFTIVKLSRYIRENQST